MWQAWPAKKKVGLLTQRRPLNRNPPRFCNLSNLRVIETNGSGENSLQDASNTNSQGHSSSQHPGDLKPSHHNLVPIQPSKSNASFKVKQKYFNKRKRRRNRRSRKDSKVDSAKGPESREKEPIKSDSKSLKELSGQSENVSVPSASSVSSSQSAKDKRSSDYSGSVKVSDNSSSVKVSDKSGSGKVTETNDKVENMDTNEDLFEEVEVASFEAEGQEVPVSFRKTRVKYLKYKKQCFFKPKFYDIDKQSVTVSCLSSTKDISEDILGNKTMPKVSEDTEQECVEEGSDQTEPAEDFDEADLMLIDADDEIVDESSDKEDAEDVSKEKLAKNDKEKKETQLEADSKKPKTVPDTKVESAQISVQINDEKKPIQVKDAKKATQIKDAKKATQIKDTNKTAQIKDVKKATQVKDTNKTAQIRDAKKTTQISDKKKTSPTKDSNKLIQVTDGAKTAQVGDLTVSEKVADEKSTTQVVDAKESTKVPEVKMTAQNADEENKTQLADVKDSDQVADVQKTVQVSDVKKITEIGDAKELAMDAKETIQVGDTKKTTQVDSNKVPSADAPKAEAKSSPKKKPNESTSQKKAIEVNQNSDALKSPISSENKISKAGASDKPKDNKAKRTPPSKVIEVIDLEDDEEEEIKPIKSKLSSQALPRVYKKFANQSLSIYQGKSVIQMSLDSWKSHLIGMEYLIEVQDKVKDEILSHHCVLCNTALPFGKFKSIVVLNHINSYEHIASYMEKFFPTYSFRENKGYDNSVTLQKVCEEINETYGYYSICITALDKFVPCKETLRKAISNPEKSYEISGFPDLAFIKKTFEKVFEEEIKAVMKSLFQKLSERQKAIHEKKRLKSLLLAKKGTPVSSFLKLKLASSDFRKPAKPTKAKTSASALSVSASADPKDKELAKDGTGKNADDSDEIEILSPEKVTPKESAAPAMETSVQKESPKGKEKSSVKPSLHSKHCPKRNQFKGNSRSTGKASLNNELAIDAASKTDSKQKRGMYVSNASAIKSDSGNKNFKQRGFKTNNKDLANVHSVSARQTKDSNQASDPYRKVNIKFEKGQDLQSVTQVPKKTTRADSPSKERSSSPYKRIVRRVSKSPPRRVITSPLRVSPTRRITSPLRLSPTRRITSPLRLSPIRRHSRSPNRRIRRPLSPVNKFPRRRSRSPVRRRSRSPLRRLSRSPARRSSRSPYKRRSRSPARKHSRSPVKRRSKSPSKRSIRSPARGYARSPVRRKSRSPHRKYSRSPRRRRSRSYERKRSRSPINRRSRSPMRSRSPRRRVSLSPPSRQSSASGKYKNTFRAVSPYEHRIKESSRDSFGKYSNSRSPQRSMGKHSSRYDSTKHRTGSPSSLSEKFIPFLNSLTNADIDLDPVSDEDESKYFSNVDEIQGSEGKIPSVQKKFVIDLLKKFSMADNPSDAAVNKFMEFMQAHSTELQEMMGSKSSAKSSDSSLGFQQQTSFLQRCLFENLGIKRDQLPPTNDPFATPSPTAGPSFTQQAYLTSQLPKYGLGQMIPGLDHVNQTLSQAKSFSPGFNIAAPNQFPPMSQKLTNPVSKPIVTPEVMFKDLKAKVSKLFGPNANQRMPEANSAFRAEQAPTNFDRNQPDSSKYVSPGQKSMFDPMGPSSGFGAQSIPGIRDEGPSHYNQSAFYGAQVQAEQSRGQSVQVPPPNAKVSFCDSPSASVRGNLFPVVNRSVNEAKVSLAQRLASVLVKVGMIDVPAPLLQEMLMKIGAFSSSPPQDITEGEIVSILKKLGYL